MINPFTDLYAAYLTYARAALDGRAALQREELEEIEATLCRLASLANTWGTPDFNYVAEHVRIPA